MKNLGIRRLALVAAIASALWALPAPLLAHPDEVGDVWGTVGPLVDIVGGRKCSVTGYGPDRVGETLHAGASMNCGRTWQELEITVCIQVRQPLVSEGVTWQDYKCNAAQRMNSDNVGTSTSAPCLPGTWAYRIKIAAAAYRGGETPYSGIFVGDTRTYTCGIS